MVSMQILRSLLVMFVCAVLLSACGGGTSAPTTSIADPTGAAGGNSPGLVADPVVVGSQKLQITGDPIPAVLVAESYDFEPRVSPIADSVRFTIQNLPSWASFDEATGRLTGTPTSADVGTYRNIVIGASDTSGSAFLPAFDVSVTQSANGTALVSWQPPLKNTDGSALTDLSGFKIRVGRSASKLTRQIDITNPGISSLVIEELSAGPWYFAVIAVNSKGIQSALSAVRSKVVR